MFYIHILTDFRRIENTGSKIHKVLSSKLKQACLDEGLRVRERACKQDCGQIDIRVDCVEIRTQENESEDGYLIVPEFFILGRPYPIYVYLYAILTYCLNPWMGQREATKRTRERFGLKTFSHTTLGRAMKKLEKLIKGHENESLSETETGKTSEVGDRKFPTVDQTKTRRDKVASYLKKAAAEDSSLSHETSQPRKQPDYRRPPYKGAFIDACHSIVEYTFLKYHCLLL